MIYSDGKILIIVWVISIYTIDFETEELESCNLKLRITSEEWLEKNNYSYIGAL